MTIESGIGVESWYQQRQICHHFPGLGLLSLNGIIAIPLIDMDQYLFVETLPGGTSQRSKHLQQSKVRSHIATFGHRKTIFKRKILEGAPRIPESWEQPHRTWISGDASGSEYIDTEPSRDSSKYGQLAKRFNARPQSLLSASRRDPFGTYPVSKPVKRFEQLLDFGKSQLTHELIPLSNGQYGQLSTIQQP
jgi:hypothetical protein